MYCNVKINAVKWRGKLSLNEKYEIILIYTTPEKKNIYLANQSAVGIIKFRLSHVLGIKM